MRRSQQMKRLRTIRALRLAIGLAVVVALGSAALPAVSRAPLVGNPQSNDVDSSIDPGPMTSPDEAVPDDDERRMSAKETAEALRDRALDPTTDLLTENISERAATVLSAIGNADRVIQAGVRSDAPEWGNIVVVTNDGNTIEVWWQQYDSAKGSGEGLAAAGDTIETWKDGTEVVVRDHSPEFVQLIMVREDMIGSVIVEAGMPLPVDFVGAVPPAGDESVVPPSVDYAVSIAREVLGALVASGF